MNFPKITVGVPTYNRLDFLKIMSASLYRSDLSLSPNIRIYDDCSSEFDRDALRMLFPTAKTITINNVNLRSDKNIYQMYVDFMSTDDEYFFNADSDIIFDSKWLNRAMEMMEETDGVLTLFNTRNHKPYGIINDTLCLKHTIGSAGTMFRRERIADILDCFDALKKIEGFDWQWSGYLKDRGIKIYCVNNSLVQHIGYTGQNSILSFDVGKGFKIETVEDGQVINDIFVDCIDKLRQENEFFLKRHEKLNNSLLYHLYKCVTIPIKKILPKPLANRLIKINNERMLKNKRKP